MMASQARWFPIYLSTLLLACGSGAAQDTRTPSELGGSSGTGGSSDAGGSSGEGSAGDSTTDKAGIGGGGSGSSGRSGAGSGGRSGSAGRASSGGASGNAGSGGSGGSAGRAPSQGPLTCSDDLPDDAPALKSDEWTFLGPPDLPWGNNAHATGFTIHPCNPGVLFVCIGSFESYGGVFRSLDAGKSWAKVGRIPSQNTTLSGCDRLRADPDDAQHIYLATGVRGAMGFFVSWDGGDTFEIPAGFSNLQAEQNLYPFDVYDMSLDPSDFQHILLTSHSAWGDQNTKWNGSSGVLESKDGGNSWLVHEPGSWGTGHSVHFLFDPDKGIGDANTWLIGTQGDAGARFRTADAGGSWTKVSDDGIAHGGGTIYYASNGTVYAAGYPGIQRSSDNGLTWENVSAGSGNGYLALFGDGKNLYTAPNFGPSPFVVSSETDGANWTSFNDQQFEQGPFEMAMDAEHGILYASSLAEGVWALRVAD